MTKKHKTGAVLFTSNLQSLAEFYAKVMGMRVLLTEKDHIRLELGTFLLTVHLIPPRYAKNIIITKPPVVREAGAMKLALPVKQIAKAREIAATLGGEVYDVKHEWQYDGSTICDGYDPDGNVFQLWQ